MNDAALTFGPVPSRRLGRSLGIGNVLPKSCSYSCVYCQVGPTETTEAEPRSFFEPAAIRDAVDERVSAVRKAGGRVDYLTFVPDGEPTLDANLEATIELLRPLEIPIAVISNASLVWRRDVRAILMRADWVSLKVDAVDEALWRRVNQPDDSLRLEQILDGILSFASSFEGELATETMLLSRINDGSDSVTAVADFLARVDPDVAYLAVPTRPPREPWARPPGEAEITRAHEIFKSRLPTVELLIGYAEEPYSATGDPLRDLLAITSVHPMREEEARGFLDRAGVGWEAVQGLIDRGDLRKVDYAGTRFYVRRLRGAMG